MGEIKFRVWDGSEYVALSTALKRDLIGTQYDYCAYEKVITFNEIETFYENVVLEQYIVRKDKNSKEIWVNDLMQTDTDIKVVVYNESLSRFGLRSLKGGATIDISDNDYVVGTIHDMPKA